MTIWLLTGRRYRAKISLGFFERIASNDTIKGKLEVAGFAEVHVWGSGGERWAEGVWKSASQAAELPNQVSGVQLVD